MSLPTGWRRVRLSDIAQVIPGQSPPGSSYNVSGEGVPFFQGKAEFTETYPVVRKFTTAGTKFAQLDDVLLSIRAPVGPTNIAPCYCAIGRGLAAVRATDLVDQRYLFWALRSSIDSLAGKATGSTFSAVSGAQVRAHEINLAPLEEQRRVVEILEAHLSRLDAADAEVASAKRRQETWRRQSLDQLVRETASGRTTLGTLVRRIEAGRSFGGSAPPAAADGWGIVKVSAMTWGEFRPGENKAVGADKVDPRYEIRPGDVLISRANTTEYVGAPVFVEATRARLLLSDKSLRIIPAEGVAARWLATVLAARSSRQQVSRLATGTKDSMRNISQQALLSIAVPTATPTQQAQVVDRAALLEETAHRLRSELIATQERATQLRRALLSAAFSGRFGDRSRRQQIAELVDV